MKISDLLKKLGINVDDEVDDQEGGFTPENKESSASKSTLSENKEENNDNKTSVSKVAEDTVIVEKEDKKMVTPKYDVKTGLFDLSGIEDGELKSVLKLSNDTVKANKNSQTIAKAIEDKLGTVQLADGITKDAILALLDRSGIKVTDEGVTGVNEAFDNLKSAQAGLFKANKEKEKSSPILEGFAPQGQSGTGNGTPNSFVEAFSMME